MRLKRWIALVVIVAGIVASAGGQPAPPDEPAAREAVSPAEAIRQPLGRRVTVEFRVGTATMARYTDHPVKEPRLLFLQPDAVLAGGAEFEAILSGKAVTHLDNLDLLDGDRPDKFFGGKSVRITGTLQAHGPGVVRTYWVTVADLDDFEVVRLRFPGKAR
jgi:hypothetical protein